MVTAEMQKPWVGMTGEVVVKWPGLADSKENGWRRVGVRKQMLSGGHIV